MTNAQKIGNRVDQEVGQTKSKDVFDLERQLAPDLFNLKAKSNSRNQSTVLMDQEPIDSVVFSQATNDQNPPPCKAEISKVNHAVPSPSDEQVAVFSTKAYTASCKNWSRNFVKQFTYFTPKSATSIKSRGIELEYATTKSNLTTKLKQNATKKPKSKINIESFRKTLANPAAMIIILGITSIALFLVYISETSQEPQQFAKNSGTEISPEAEPLPSSTPLIVDKSVNMDPEFLNERPEDSQVDWSLSSVNIEGEN